MRVLVATAWTIVIVTAGAIALYAGQWWAVALGLSSRFLF